MYSSGRGITVGRLAFAAAAIIIAGMLAFGCGKPESGDVTVTETATVSLPSDIPEGAQCSECGMYVEMDGLYSGQAVKPDGGYIYFCDIGDLLTHLDGGGEAKFPAAYLRDHNTGGWINAYEAFYLDEAPVKTPMRYGIAAFKSRPDAETFRADNGGGTIYTYAGIQAEKPYR